MAKNTGTPFERLTKEVYDILLAEDRYTKVEHDIKLPSPDGARQIDVLIRSEMAGMRLLTIVECRDYGKRLDMTHVDGVHSKLLDVGAHKAVIVTRKGFSKNAMRKAERLGITLCTLNEAKDELIDIGFQVPLLVTVVTPTQVQLEYEIASGNPATIDKDNLFQINDADMFEELRAALVSGQAPHEATVEMCRWCPPQIETGTFFRAADGTKIPLSHLVIQYRIELEWYFGHLTDFEETKTLVNLTEDNAQILIKLEELTNFEKRLARYNRLEDVPKIKGALSVSAIAVPEIAPQGGVALVMDKKSRNYFLTKFRKQ